MGDANCSSGEAYRHLKAKGITAYIPVNGSYKAERDGFSCGKEDDSYACSRKGARLAFKGERQLKVFVVCRTERFAINCLPPDPPDCKD